jgi:dolichol-phosphate mannosyltransferase
LVRIGVVIPCYKVRRQILDVIYAIGPEVETIYVIDDCCPEGTGQFIKAEVSDPRVKVIFHAQNQGVGGAVLTGIVSAIHDGLDVVVKVDGDGQMSPELLPLFVQPIAHGLADYSKGNRFYNPDDVRAMPAVRLLGNAVLSFMAKLSSGYWNIFDPTNGYIAISTRLAAVLPLEKVSRRYFFETDLLFRVGLMRAKVIDIPMLAVYGDELSSLSVIRELPRFLVGNVRNFIKRIAYNYFLRDFNIGSLELFFGFLMTFFGTLFGIINWGISAPATAGTVMIAALPVSVGLYLLIGFVNYDAQQVPREPITPRLGKLTKTDHADPPIWQVGELEKIDSDPGSDLRAPGEGIRDEKTRNP